MELHPTRIFHIGSVALLTALLAYLASPAPAQTITAVVSGTVIDSSTAAVPGASVTLLNSGTSVRRSATTDASGSFVFPSVEPATYSLVVEAQGFKRFERTGLQVTASERVSAGNIQLDVGALSESVTVSGMCRISSSSRILLVRIRLRA